MTAAIIDRLQSAWPTPVELRPSVCSSDPLDADVAFVAALHGLVDEGLVMIEAILSDAASAPRAQGAVLTRKGATALNDIARANA